MSYSVVSLAGVIRFVSYEIFDSNVFDGCLRASHLDVYGKAWCQTKDSASWGMVAEDGTPLHIRNVTSYVLTVVSDLENVSIPEANARWKQFVRHAKDAVKMNEFRVVALKIE